MIKRLGALLGLWPLVYTRDYDGEIRLRIARYNHDPWENNTWSVVGIVGGYPRCRLMPMAP